MQTKILHLQDWTHSALGTPIPLFQKKHTDGEPPLIFIGGIHGDEPEGVRLAEDFLSWLQQSEKKGVPHKSWILIPNINPDGSLKMQRTNGRGVDLNRNFPSDDWQPDSKGPRYNPGPYPGSEAEVQALCHLFDAEKPQAIFHFHSWEPCVVWSGDGGQPWAETLAQSSGLLAKEDIGYPTPGSLGQYGALNLKIPVICIEAQEKSPLELIWPTFGSGLIEIISGGRS